MRWLWPPAFLALILPVHAADLEPVRLGLVVPAIVDAEPTARSMRQAAEMAVAEWSPRLARRIELRVKDDVFDPRQAAATAGELVEEGAWGVVGHFYSSSSLAASVVYHEAGVPLVMPTATHPRLTAQGFENVFRVCGRDDGQGAVAAAFVLGRAQARRVSVVHDRTEYGRGLVATFRQALTRRGTTRIVSEESVAQGDQDFAAQVARLKAGRPDAVYFGGVFREAAHLLRQLRQAGVRAAFVGGDAILDSEFVRLAGEDAATGAYLTSAPDPRLVESARPAIQRYESRYGALGPHVLYTYDALGVLLSAVQAAKPAAAGTDDVRKLAQAIRARPYAGSLGTIRWDKNGDRVPPPYAVYEVKRGGSVQGWFEQMPVAGPAATGAATQAR